MAIKKQKARVKRRERKNIEKGQAHIVSSFNNTMVTTPSQARTLLLTFFGPFPGVPENPTVVRRAVLEPS